jgi:hypothetical protein
MPAHSLNALIASSRRANVSHSVPLMNSWCTIYIFIPLGTLVCYLNATPQVCHHSVPTHDNGDHHRYQCTGIHHHRCKASLYARTCPLCCRGFHSWSASTSHVCFFVTLATCISYQVSLLVRSRCCLKQPGENGQQLKPIFPYNNGNDYHYDCSFIHLRPPSLAIDTDVCGF